MGPYAKRRRLIGPRFKRFKKARRSFKRRRFTRNNFRPSSRFGRYARRISRQFRQQRRWKIKRTAVAIPSQEYNRKYGPLKYGYVHSLRCVCCIEPWYKTAWRAARWLPAAYNLYRWYSGTAGVGALASAAHGVWNRLTDSGSERPRARYWASSRDPHGRPQLWNPLY